MCVRYSLLVLVGAHIAHLCQEGDLLEKVFIRNKMAQLIALTFVQDYPMKVLHLHVHVHAYDMRVLDDIMMCYASGYMCCAAEFFEGNHELDMGKCSIVIVLQFPANLPIHF